MEKFAATITLKKRFGFLTGDAITADEAATAVADFSTRNGVTVTKSVFDGNASVAVEFVADPNATPAQQSFFGSLVGDANAAFPVAIAVAAGFVIVGLAAVSWTVENVRKLTETAGQVVNSGSGKLLTAAIVAFALSSLIGTVIRNSK